MNKKIYAVNLCYNRCKECCNDLNIKKHLACFKLQSYEKIYHCDNKDAVEI